MITGFGQRHGWFIHFVSRAPSTSPSTTPDPPNNETNASRAGTAFSFHTSDWHWLHLLASEGPFSSFLGDSWPVPAPFVALLETVNVMQDFSHPPI
jgi:hypothetical protein